MRSDIPFRSSDGTNEEVTVILEKGAPETSSNYPSPNTVPLGVGETNLGEITEQQLSQQLLDLQQRVGDLFFRRVVTNVLNNRRISKESKSSDGHREGSQSGHKEGSHSGNKNLENYVKSEENETSSSIPGSSGEVTNAPNPYRPSSPTPESTDPSTHTYEITAPVTFTDTSP